ncbi:MAG: hypothetical protein J5I59_00090 [Saprospiraceae bacterium]|nr:hypothetical protein [Saprospiraceae bacterium]
MSIRQDFCYFIWILILINSSCREAVVSADTPPVIDSIEVSVHNDSYAEPKSTVSVDSLWRRYGYDSNWVKMPEVLPGAILPYNRIIAFYGNLYSKQMGILGQLPREEMIARLNEEIQAWHHADSLTPIVPALHVIATTAQRLPGKDKMYRLRMNKSMVYRVIEMADSIKGLTFIDLQIGHSSLEREIAPWDSLLSLPRVHLAIDAEFAMYNKKVPGTVMGRLDASDINYAIDYLEKKVKQLGLPPKILIIHRFKQGMISHADQIKQTPYVQVVMHMDGWGAKELKFHSYRAYIEKEPVQYTGFKLFYKNDTKFGKKLLTPEEVLSLHPQPLYIQYQ